MKVLRRLFPLAVFGFALSAFEDPASDARTIILVRHAEKANPQGDTVLSERGQTRAKALAEMLRDVKIHSVYTSQMIRTKQTADPVARQKELSGEVLLSTDVDALVLKLRKTPSGGVALVVGHSNTIPQIGEKLGGAAPAIGDDEFDRLLILRLPASGKPEVLTLRYGGR